MSAAAWDADESAPDDYLAGQRALPIAVSMSFIRLAMRRRRRTLLLGSLAGVALALAFMLLVPPSYTADTALAISHGEGANSEVAMATDVSLATTRALAQQVIDETGIDETTVTLLASVTVTATTPDVLTISLKASSQAEAERRLAAYATRYLAFRGEQLTAQNTALSAGMKDRIGVLNKQSDQLTDRIDGYTEGGMAATGGVAELISERAQLQSQINTLQQSIDDSNVRTTSLIAASRVIDRAAVTPSNPLKRIVLVLATGLIGGTAIGVAYVLFSAIVSEKLQRRIEVATALEVPVTASVARVRPLPAWTARVPVLRGRREVRADNLRRLARAIEVALPSGEEGRWLVVGCIDNAREVALGVVLAAAEQQRDGRTVRLIDLTDAGVVEGAVKTILADDPSTKLAVSRPRTSPSLARDAADIITYGPATREIPAVGETEVFLGITDLDPSVGAFHLTAWTQRVVIAVTAGRSTAERVRTAADLVRAAGLDLWSGLLIRSEPTDASPGMPIDRRPAEADTGPTPWR